MAELFGKELIVHQIPEPLIAAPETCFDVCLGLDEEHGYACRDAVLEPGNVYIIACTKYDEENCNARKHHIATIRDEGKLDINIGYIIDGKMLDRIADDIKADPKTLRDSMDESSGLKDLSEALMRFSLRELY